MESHRGIHKKENNFVLFSYLKSVFALFFLNTEQFIVSVVDLAVTYKMTAALFTISEAPETRVSYELGRGNSHHLSRSICLKVVWQ